MAKFQKNTSKQVSNTSTDAAPEKARLTDEEKLAAMQPLLFQVIEVTGGKKFPIGSKMEVWKIGVHKVYHYPYTVLHADGQENQSCDPKFCKIVKPMTPARIALAQATLAQENEEMLLVSGTVKIEKEKSVFFKHHNWFKPVWLPRSIITMAGEHSDGEQVILEVPRWKILNDHGPKELASIAGMQDAFRAMLAPKAAPKAAPRTAGIVGETTLIKAATATAAKAARRKTGK